MPLVLFALALSWNSERFITGVYSRATPAAIACHFSTVTAMSGHVTSHFLSSPPCRPFSSGKQRAQYVAFLIVFGIQNVENISRIGPNRFAPMRFFHFIRRQAWYASSSEMPLHVLNWLNLTLHQFSLDFVQELYLKELKGYKAPPQVRTRIFRSKPTAEILTANNLFR